MDNSQLDLQTVGEISEVFACIPKLYADIGEYGLNLMILDGGLGYVLVLDTQDLNDKKMLQDFLSWFEDQFEGVAVITEPVCVQFANGGVLLEALLKYIDDNPHGVDVETLNNLSESVDKIIAGAANQEFEGLEEEVAGQEAVIVDNFVMDAVCDAFNALLNETGFAGAEAYYNADDDIIDITLDRGEYKGSDFSSFCERIAECAKDTMAVTAIEGDYIQMHIQVETPFSFVDIIRDFIEKSDLLAAEDLLYELGEMPQGSDVLGLNYIQALEQSNKETIEFHPMIPTFSIQGLKNAFYLGSIATTSVSWRRLETIVIQSTGEYGRIKEGHRPFIMH